MKNSVAWTFFFFTMSAVKPGVVGWGVMELHFLHYTDGCREDANTNKCDPMFTLCLTRPSKPLRISRQNCVYKSTGESGHFHNTNDINLSMMTNIKGLENPWIIEFETLKDDGVKLIVQVRDDDFIDDDHLEIWSITMKETVHPTLRESQWNEKSMSKSGHTLKFKIKIYCTDNTYGPYCSVLCLPPGANDNYVCDKKTGNKNCLKGWMGQKCNVYNFQCNTDNCIEGACVEVQGVYTCKCSDHFEGTKCNIENTCRLNTCVNGGVCNFNITTRQHSCDCGNLWTGQNCETRMNPCDISPCQHGGSCTANEANTQYTCECSRKWTGDKCEEMRDPCDFTPCQNGGSCSSNRKNADYDCDCSKEWMGENCTERRDPCDFSPCQNEGFCWSTEDNSQYNCSCSQEWLGDSCEVRQDPCDFSPCQNGGFCSSNSEKTQYFCNCTKKWMGENCTERRDPCDSGPCQNEGFCLSTEDNEQYNCSCSKEWQGNNCEVRRDPCDFSPCRNGGSCSTNSKKTQYSCYCSKEWTGGDCSERRNPCEFSPCQNGGSCTSNRAKTKYICNCTREWIGVDCEERRNPCDLSLCRNGGSCLSNQEKTEYTCSCADDWTGENCTKKRYLCDFSPCQNGGICWTDEAKTQHYCDCSDQWTGEECTERRDPCYSFPCKNNGSCIISSDKSRYNCNCIYPYEGNLCEVVKTTTEPRTTETMTGAGPENAGQVSVGSFPVWIVGVIVALLILLGVGICFFLYRRKRMREKEPGFILPAVRYSEDVLAFDNNAYSMMNDNSRSLKSNDPLPFLSPDDEDENVDSLKLSFQAEGGQDPVEYDDMDDDGYLKANHVMKLPSAHSTPGSERAAANPYADFTSLKHKGPQDIDDYEDEVHYHDLDELAMTLKKENEENPYRDSPSNLPSQKKKKPRERYDFVDPNNILNADMKQRNTYAYDNGMDQFSPAPATPKRSQTLPEQLKPEGPYAHAALNTTLSDPFRDQVSEEDEDLPDFGLPPFRVKPRGVSGEYDTPTPGPLKDKPKSSSGYEIPDADCMTPLAISRPKDGNHHVKQSSPHVPSLTPEPTSASQEDDSMDEDPFLAPPPPLTPIELKELDRPALTKGSRPLSIVTGKTGFDEKQEEVANFDHSARDSDTDMRNEDGPTPDPLSNANLVPLCMENFGFSLPQGKNYNNPQENRQNKTAVDKDSSNKAKAKIAPLFMENLGFGGSETNSETCTNDRVEANGKNAVKPDDSPNQPKGNFVSLYMENLGFTDS